MIINILAWTAKHRPDLFDRYDHWHKVVYNLVPEKRKTTKQRK